MLNNSDTTCSCSMRSIPAAAVNGTDASRKAQPTSAPIMTRRRQPIHRRAGEQRGEDHPDGPAHALDAHLRGRGLQINDDRERHGQSAHL